MAKRRRGRVGDDDIKVKTKGKEQGKRRSVETVG